MMNPTPIEKIAEFAGSAAFAGDGKIFVDKVSTDSRTLKRGELFVALRGENFDGHNFVESAAKAGAAGALGLTIAGPAAAAGLRLESTTLNLLTWSDHYANDQLKAVSKLTGLQGRSVREAGGQPGAAVPHPPLWDSRPRLSRPTDDLPNFTN